MTRAERFLSVLEDLGGSAGNGRCRDELGWQDATYERVKDNLLAAGKISRGRGRGGSVAVIRRPKTN